MKRTLLLPIAFLGLLSLGAYRSLRYEDEAERFLAEGLSLNDVAEASPPAEAGSFPAQWINGADCSTEPKMQVHAYDADTYILRQSKCEIFEAPFLYLLFGDDKVLLMDTGANNATPIWDNVYEVIRGWLAANGKSSIDLIVAHTHSHFDHVQGDPQFVGKPFVKRIVPLGLPDIISFWGFLDYPNDVQTIDLGNRVIDVLGTPGHLNGSVTLYDRDTHLLLTGDIVYPGHLFVFSALDWPDFVTSIRRLVNWAATHPVEYVLGCHIEMSADPGGSFAYGTQVHPNEHVLQFRPDILLKVYAAASAMGNQPACRIFDEFVIHPVYLCGIFWNG